MPTRNALSLVKSLMDMRSMRQTGKRARTRALGAINDAMSHLSSDFPEAFVTRSAQYPIIGMVDGDELNLRVSVDTSDNMVFRFVDLAGNDIVAGPTAWTPDTKRHWDGLLHIMVKTGDEWVTKWCRHFFERTVGGASRYSVAVDSPWRNITDTGLSFKLIQTQFSLPAGMASPQDPVLYRPAGGGTFQLCKEGRQSWRFRRKPPDGDIFSGEPGWYAEGDTRTLAPPSVAPTLTAGDGATWVGPLPQGRFYLCYTYGLGYQGLDRTTASGLEELVWESGPSPIAIFDHSEGSNAGKSIIMKGANIEPHLGFYSVGDPRHGRSGLVIRWYVARAGDTGTPSTVSPTQQDLTFYPVADVELTNDSCTFEWDGSVFPEQRIELRPSYAYRLYDVSHPFSADGNLFVQAMSSPLKLQHGADVLEIDDKAFPAFLHLALYYFCMRDADRGAANDALALYEDMKGQVSRNINAPADSYPLARASKRARDRRGERWHRVHIDDDFSIEY